MLYSDYFCTCLSPKLWGPQGESRSWLLLHVSLLSTVYLLHNRCLKMLSGLIWRETSVKGTPLTGPEGRLENSEDIWTGPERACRSLPDMESCWHSQGCKWTVMKGYGACGNTEGRSACLEQTECWGKWWMSPKDFEVDQFSSSRDTNLLRVTAVYGNRKQSENIQNVLGEAGLVSFCWWQIVPRVSSVCFLGGHGARQQDRVVRRGSQEETDGCSWGMLNLKRPRNPSKCVFEV